MKPFLGAPSIAILAASALLAVSAQAANVAVNNGTLTTTINVAAGDWFQTTAGTLDINAGGSVVVTNASFETIIMQNAAATSTINLNTGGIMDFSGASGGGATFYIGNNLATAIGILNVQGGTFNGSGLTNIIFGRDNGVGIMNISAGSVTLGDSTPLFDTNGGVESSRTNSFINFTNGSSGTLAITGASQTTYQNLWNSGDLRFAGVNTGTFADHFVVNGNILSAVPEPSIALLGGLGLLGLLRRRR